LLRGITLDVIRVGVRKARHAFTDRGRGGAEGEEGDKLSDEVREVHVDRSVLGRFQNLFRCAAGVHV
jgi:hypothetical protein